MVKYCKSCACLVMMSEMLSNEWRIISLSGKAEKGNEKYMDLCGSLRERQNKIICAFTGQK